MEERHRRVLKEKTLELKLLVAKFDEETRIMKVRKTAEERYIENPSTQSNPKKLRSSLNSLNSH